MNQRHGQNSWQRVFGMDLRALALFRIVMGLLLLIDLWMRSRSLEAMYTDAGIAPRGMVLEYDRDLAGGSQIAVWSLHMLGGSLAWEWALVAIAALAAVSMTVGWRTRIATVISWILLVSIQVRNPLITHSGDTLLRVSMFWAMFLPLGAICSLDARRGPARTTALLSGLEIVSPATAGLLMTLFSLYFFAGIAKLNETWFSGMAMEYVSRLDIYSTGMGQAIRNYPGLLKAITWSTLVIEVVLPLFLFVPWQNRRIRVLLMLVFYGLHVGIALTMMIGLFQYISMAIWLALLPGGFFTWMGQRIRFLQWPENRVPVEPLASRALSRSINGVAAFLVVYFFLWNTANIYQVPRLQNAMPASCRFIGNWLNMQQQFSMFDAPPAYSPWFVYDALLADGSHRDIFRNAPVSYERPLSVLATIPEHHWRRFHRNLVRSDKRFEPFRESAARYVMNHWNATHDEDRQVVALKVSAFLDEIAPYSSEPAGQMVMVWSRLGSGGSESGLFDEVLKELRSKGEILP
jgi:hypothetical protein